MVSWTPTDGGAEIAGGVNAPPAPIVNVAGNRTFVAPVVTVCGVVPWLVWLAGVLVVAVVDPGDAAGAPLEVLWLEPPHAVTRTTTANAAKTRLISEGSLSITVVYA